MLCSQYPTRLLSLPGAGSGMEKLGDEVRYRRGETIVRAGETPGFCYFVKKGRVMAAELTRFGEERIYNFMEEGSMLLEPNVMFSSPPPVDFSAATDCVLVRIDKKRLLDAMDDDRELRMKIFESVSHKFFAAMEGLREYNNHTVPWKVCNLLTLFADRYGEDDGGRIVIRERLTQKLLADMLAVNRVTMARVLKDLMGRGAVERRADGFYSICGADAMERIKAEIDDAAYSVK